MDKRELIIAGIFVVVVIVLASIIFAPNNTAKQTTIEVLNNDTIGENGTVYVKLKDNNNTSLSEKTVHIKITDENGTVVYEGSGKTHATGVAIFKMNNVSPGDYNLSVTFDGDENHTSSSISKSLKILGEHIEDTLSDTALTDDSTSNNQNSGSSSRSSSSSSSRSSGSGSRSGGSSQLPEYDEDGNQM